VLADPVWLPRPPRFEDDAETVEAGPFFGWLRATIMTAVGLTVSSVLAEFGLARAPLLRTG
jgi:hypothetical protein